MLDKSPIIAFAPTTDLQRARAFYESVLGLSVLSIDNYAVAFDANGIMLRIAAVPPPFTPQPFTILGWTVSDIAASIQALVARGVTFERFGFFEQDALGVWIAPGGTRVAWFKDPDGNTLSLTQFE